jgi:hypothetical protein
MLAPLSNCWVSNTKCFRTKASYCVSRFRSTGLWSSVAFGQLVIGIDCTCLEKPYHFLVGLQRHIQLFGLRIEAGCRYFDAPWQR